MPQSEAAAKQQDYTVSIVPMSERRSPLSMGLLWLTMVVSFPTVMAGFDWYRSGFSLQQVLICAATSCVLLVFYTTCSAWLGALTGQTWGLLVRRVYGSIGSKFVSLNFAWVFIAFYALCAALLAQGLNSIFHTAIPTMWLAALLAAFMCINNIFGFTGIVNFARFLVAPILTIWVALTATKVIALSPASIWTHSHNQSLSYAMTVISSYILGLGVWGDEPDFWRFSKSRVGPIAIPLTVAIVIGLFLFPVTGWLLANLTGITNTDGSMNILSSFVFGPAPLLLGLIMILSYFACNDSNLYGGITVFESVVQTDRRKAVILFTSVGMLFAMWLSTSPNALEVVCSINAVIGAAPTVILCIEFLLLSKVLKIKHDFSFVAKANDLPQFKFPAIIALVCAYAVGIITSGIIPGTASLQVGICALQASLTGAIIYFCLRLATNKKVLQTKVAEPRLAEKVLAK